MSAYEAKRTPLHRGPAAWSTILPGQDPAIVLDRDLTADFVIVGAGFAGLSAALRLKQINPKSKIIILDAGRIAEGAAGRNSGFMIDLPHEITTEDYAGQGADNDRVMIGLNRKAIALARGAVERYGIDAAYFDAAGKINGAASAAADSLNRSYQAHLGDLGETSEMLDSKAMKDITGSTYYVSGLYSPGTVMLQPAGYIRGFAAGLRRDGVQIFENTPVLKMEKSGSSWQLSTSHHKVTAGKVLLANNGHLESFGFARQRLMHIFLFASMTVDLGADMLRKLGGKPRWGITPSDPMGTTMRRIDTPQGGNRIVTRTCAVFSPDMAITDAAVRRAARVHRKKFDQRFPALGSVPMEFSWAGHLCLTRNGVAVMRELDHGLFSACVDNGLGTTRSTLTGMGAAELASGIASDVTRHFTQEAEPTRLPPPPLSRLGANAYLRWKEWKAANE